MLSSFISANPLKTSLLAGVLLGTAWLSWGLWPLALVCPGILILCLLEQDKRTRFLVSVVFFTSAWAIAFHWNALHPNTITALSSIIALFSMICIQAGLMTFFSSPRRGFTPFITAISAFLGIAIWDWFSLNGPLAMPGTMLGLSISDSFLARMWSPFIGSYGLTLLVLGLNGAWVAVLRSQRKRTLAALILLALSFLPVLFPPQLSAISRMFPVALVQPGMSPSQWADVSSVTKASGLYEALGRAKGMFVDTQLLILPETSLPIGSSTTQEHVVRRWADSLGVSVLTGAIVLDSSGTFFNAAVSVDFGGLAYESHKRRLVPFVESVPLANYLPFSSTFRLDSGGVSAYGAGKDPSIVQLSGLKVGVLICFESFFPSDAAELRSLGADMLVVLTQDGWWQSQTARNQHAAYTRLVAFSSGLPTIQSSVDGISAIWDATGNRIAGSTGNGAQIVFAHIPIQRAHTLFSKTGNFPSNLLLGGLLLLYLMFALRKSPYSQGGH